jgi:hypothetical protein
MIPSATRYQRPCWPRFWQSTESLDQCWATNHTIMQWLRLHTHPKLHAHQCGAHIRCLNHFICSGRAYETIGNPLPLPLLTQILTVGWKLGSLLGYKPYHYSVVEAPYPSKAACTSMRSTYKVFEPLVDGYMKTSATRYHRPCWSRFWQSAESLGHCWATNHTIMQWLRLHTHPELLAHQCGTHIRCLNHSYAVDGHTKILATRYHRPCWPRFWQSNEDLGHCMATNHTIMQYHFICSGCAYAQAFSWLSKSGSTRAMVTGCWWFHMPVHCIQSSSNTLYVLHIDVHAALDGYGASTTAYWYGL